MEEIGQAITMTFTSLTSYLMTLTRMPQNTHVVAIKPPQATDDGKKEDACWLYEGVDPEGWTEDDTSELFQNDELLKRKSPISIDEVLQETRKTVPDPLKLSKGIAGRISLHNLDQPSVYKRTKRRRR